MVSELKIAKALKRPDGYETYYLPLDMLDPIAKVMEEQFYVFVKKSIEDNGLYHPIVVYPIMLDEWFDELVLDKHQIPPPTDSNPLRYRVQCGCNRYYALKELGYDAVEALVIEEKSEAWDMCHNLRIDKRWQRPDNFRVLRGGK